MGTLHASGEINFFSNKCRQLWDKWNDGPALQRVPKRKTAIKNTMIQLMIRIGIKRLDIQFVNSPGAAGQFSWGEWSMEIGPDQIADNNIRCAEFVDLCATLYHETRHAEQFTRMAQGVRLGRLLFPGNKKLPLFYKTHFISKNMGMEYAATNYAVNHRNEYKTFAATPRLTHCTMGVAKGWDNWDPTVDDWLQRTYSRSKSTFSQIGQSDAVKGLGNIGGQYSKGGGTMNVLGGRRDAIEKQYYYRAEDEKDAFAIEALCGTALKNRFANYNARKNWRRTDPRW